MKKGLSFLMFFIMSVMVASVFADIAIKTDQQIYNLGNKIKASASVLDDKNFEGLFKLTLLCGNYKLQYFLTPISLEANFRTAIDVPELVVTSNMLGDCSIIGDLATNENLIIEEKPSNSFSVTRLLNVLPVNSRITALPGDVVQIWGIVNEAFGNNVLNALVRAALDNNSYDADTIDGKFNFTIKIQKNIKSGQHTIEITASDVKNNIGESSIELGITAVPTYIKLDLNSNQLLPGSKVDFASSLYDQAEDLINASVEVEFISPTKNKVFRKHVQSNEKVTYEINQYAEPGNYFLISTYRDLTTQAVINITSVRDVRIKYENESVLVENTGNVLFEDELTFILENELKKYPITKKVKIDPGRILNVDLSKEVPMGAYNVLIGSINQTLSYLMPENKDALAANVTIHDNRPAYKKIASGLSSISGNLVGADGVLAKNPLIAPITLVIILSLIILRYGRKPIMRLIKGKKDDEKDKA